MRNIKKLLVLASATLILSGCNDIESSSNIDSSVDSSINEVKDWTPTQKDLLVNYCGESLPYPSGFEGDVSLEIVDDGSGAKVLQIINASPLFSIGDYYNDLIRAQWNGIYDYNGEIAQKDSSGNTYYEFVKISSAKNTGYHITYYFYEESDSNGNKSSYNVIECRNDFGTSLDERTKWNDEEKEVLSDVTTELPPLLKLGKNSKVVKSSENFAYCYDVYAMDLTFDNVDILENAGYSLDTEMSKSHSAYVLKKDLEDGSCIYVSVYYMSGNYVTFSYNARTVESTSWPKDFVSDFEKKSGFSVPTFESSDISKYYGYSKNGVTTIYAYTDDFSISTYELKLLKTEAIYDASENWYSNWNETFYIQPYTATDSNGRNLFAITFALLDEPYDAIQEGYPTEAVAKFLTDNKINTTFPLSFDFSSLSPYTTCHIQTVNYDYVYQNCLNTIKANPTNYVDDPTNEEEIEELAASMARSRTCMKIKMYDPAITDGTNYEFKVFEKLSEVVYKLGWSKVSNENHYIAYENETGDLLVGIDLVSGTTVLTLQYGSGNTHTPTFKFNEEQVTIAPGKSYNLDYTVDMLPYDITFSSDSDKVSVTSGGCVSVSANAPAGLVANISASMTLPNGETKQITCKVVVSGTYDYESAMQSVVTSYNAYFNLSDNDEDAAKATLIDKSSDDYTFKYYELIVKPSSITTLDDAKTLVTNTLIPAGFKNFSEGVWTSGEREDGTTFESIEYQYYDKDYNGVLLTFMVYLDSTTNAVTIRATTYAN